MSEPDPMAELEIDNDTYAAVIITAIDTLADGMYQKKPPFADHIREYRSFVNERMANHYDVAARMPGIFHPKSHADLRCPSNQLVHLINWTIERAISAYYNRVRRSIVGGEANAIVDLVDISECPLDELVIESFPNGVHFFLNCDNKPEGEAEYYHQQIEKDDADVEITDEDFEELFDPENLEDPTHYGAE
jgi:hypothetical protein